MPTDDSDIARLITTIAHRLERKSAVVEPLAAAVAAAMIDQAETDFGPGTRDAALRSLVERVARLLPADAAVVVDEPVDDRGWAAAEPRSPASAPFDHVVGVTHGSGGGMDD